MERIGKKNTEVEKDIIVKDAGERRSVKRSRERKGERERKPLASSRDTLKRKRKLCLQGILPIHLLFCLTNGMKGRHVYLN